MPTITVKPSEKYRYVVEGETPTEPDTSGPRSNPSIPEDEAKNRFGERESEVDDEWRESADSYLETIDNTPNPEDFGCDPDDYPELTWDMISPPNDPDLLTRMATYFEGIATTDDSDLIRAKLRLLDVEQMANAQIAAKAETRD